MQQHGHPCRSGRSRGASRPGRRAATTSTDGGRTFAPRARGRRDRRSGPQLALSGDQVVIAWDEGGGSGPRRIRLRAVSPRLGPIETVSAGPSAASYPAIAATADATLVAWTEETPTGSDVRVRRFARCAAETIAPGPYNRLVKERDDPTGARDRRSWPVRVYRLGGEPADDLSATSTPEERLAMTARLTVDAFALAGLPSPGYSRAGTPVSVRRLGE